MTINWEYNEAEANESIYPLISEGDHRVRIEDAEETIAKTSGNEMIKITFSVSGYNSLLFHNIVLHREPEKRRYTNINLSYLYNSFGIEKGNLDLQSWKGKIGGCKVYHDEFNGQKNAKIEKLIPAVGLPEWIEGSPKKAKEENKSTSSSYIKDEDIPF